MLTVAQERRRVEEQYVQGLRKLANRHPPDDASDLGYAPPRAVRGAETDCGQHLLDAMAEDCERDRVRRSIAPAPGTQD